MRTFAWLILSLGGCAHINPVQQAPSAHASTEIHSSPESSQGRHTASLSDEPMGPDDPRDSPFHQSYMDPQNGCHQLSIFVQRPKGFGIFRGSAGHIALGIDNRFYDFGPKNFAFNPSMILGAPGSEYLQNYLKDIAWHSKKPKNDKLTVEEAYQFVASFSKEYETTVIPVSITTREARAVEKHWIDLYARIKRDKKLKLEALKEGRAYKEEVVYKALSRQCSTEAHDSLAAAGLIEAVAGAKRIVPSSFGSFVVKNLKHTCGGVKGLAVIEVGTPQSPHPLSRARWGQEVPDGVPESQ